MKLKRIALVVAILILVIAGLGYHFVFGYVATTQVADNVTVLTRRNLLNQIGSNVVVRHDELSTIVVDTQLSPLASSTRAHVDALATTPVSKVLVTHWHPDHSGGIAAFSSDADVIAHDNVLIRLSKPQEGFGLTKPGSHHQFDARSAAGLPTQTVTHQLTISVDSATANVFHYPMAHTDGDLVVFFRESRIAVIGDLVWPNSFPYVDVHNGGSVGGLEAALRAVIAESNPQYHFVPGHGAPLNYEEIRTYLAMVYDTRHWVEKQLDEGHTLEETIATGLPQNWTKWSGPLVPSAVWIGMIQASKRPSAVTSQ